MSFRVSFPHLGADVTVDTLEELRQVVAALGLQVSAGPPLADLTRRLMAEASPAAPPPARSGRQRLIARRVAQARTTLADRPKANTNGDAETRTVRGLLELLADGPRKLADLAEASTLGRTTALEYLKRMAADGLVHQQGRGPGTRWATGRPKEVP